MALNENLEMRNVNMAGQRVKATCPNCKVRLVGDECPKCDFVRVKGYDIKPDTDMSKHGFAKELTYKHLLVDADKNIITVVEVDYYAKDFVCASCETDRFIWLKAERTGVFKSCLRCETTTGCLSQEFGYEHATYKVTAEQAMEILKGYNSPKFMIKPVEKMLFGKKYRPKRKRPKSK